MGGGVKSPRQSRCARAYYLHVYLFARVGILEDMIKLFEGIRFRHSMDLRTIYMSSRRLTIKLLLLKTYGRQERTARTASIISGPIHDRKKSPRCLSYIGEFKASRNYFRCLLYVKKGLSFAGT